MRRVLIFAVLLLVAPLAQAKSVAEWTVDLLRDVVRWPSPPALAGGRYKAAILYREDTARADSIGEQHPGWEATTVKVESGVGDDLFTQMEGLRAAGNQFHCLVITDLEPDQVLAAEHFARKEKIVLVAIVSRRPEGGSVPFAFDPQRGVAFLRYRALRLSNLDLQTMPPKMPFVMLDSEKAYEEVDRCLPDPTNKRAKPEMICHDNAFANFGSKERDKWQRGVRDLDVAVLHAFEEEKDHKKYVRGWGRDAYHPHIGLIEFLLKFRNCPAARRELPLVDASRREEMAGRIDQQCRSVPPDVAGGGVPSKAGLTIMALARAEEPELLPPFRPTLVWSELSAPR
jgi:hypothetical protein